MIVKSYGPEKRRTNFVSEKSLNEIAGIIVLPDQVVMETTLKLSNLQWFPKWSNRIPRSNIVFIWDHFLPNLFQMGNFLLTLMRIVRGTRSLCGVSCLFFERQKYLIMIAKSDIAEIVIFNVNTL